MSAAGNASGSAAPVAPSTTLALQCVSSVCGTMIGQALGESLPQKLAGGLLLCLIGAFLMAPGNHRRRRVVAVALLLALLAALKRVGEAAASTGRDRPRGAGAGANAGALTPASWGAVAVAAAIGFGVGSLGTTATDGWASSSTSALVSVPAVAGQAAADAQARLERADLQVVRERVASRAVPRATAIRTAPGRGAEVRRGTRVTLFVSTGAPQRRVRVPAVRGLTERAARSLLEQSGLTARRAPTPSASVPRGIAVRTSPAAHAEVRRGATVTLFVSTGSRARRVTIPAVRGLSEGIARARLEDLGLRVRPRATSSDGIARGRATGSSPPASTSVAAGSRVTLLVSSGPGGTAPVVVPDVDGLPQSAALERLRDAHLDPTARRVASEDVPAGRAIETDPPAGDTVDRGTPVVLRVSAGAAVERVEVPLLEGLTVEEAESRLTAAGLDYDSTSEDSSEPEGTVLRSDPPAGTFVDAGTTVQLTVSSGALVHVPDLVGNTSTAAEQALTDAGLAFRVERVRAHMPASVVTGTDPAAGSTVRRGSTVTLFASCGPNNCVS